MKKEYKRPISKLFEVNAADGFLNVVSNISTGKRVPTGSNDYVESSYDPSTGGFTPWKGDPD